MKLVERLARTGDTLFRWRSYLPLLLLPAFVASFIGLRYPLDSHAFGLAWEIGCFLLAMAGFAVRVYPVGTAPRGTSGRNTRRQKAEVLNTTGPYSVVRHPLYLANYVIALGLSCFSRAWYLPVIVALAGLLYYERIAAREEQFLEARFGDAFRRWSARVPALIPDLRLWTAPALPFSWRRAVGREFYALSLLTTAFFVLDVLEDFSVHGRWGVDAVWTTAFVAGAAVFVVMWPLKKWTRVLRAD